MLSDLKSVAVKPTPIALDIYDQTDPTTLLPFVAVVVRDLSLAEEVPSWRLWRLRCRRSWRPSLASTKSSLGIWPRGMESNRWNRTAQIGTLAVAHHVWPMFLTCSSRVECAHDS
jgi:hypothetical protein